MDLTSTQTDRVSDHDIPCTKHVHGLPRSVVDMARSRNEGLVDSGLKSCCACTCINHDGTNITQSSIEKTDKISTLLDRKLVDTSVVCAFLGVFSQLS